MGPHSEAVAGRQIHHPMGRPWHRCRAIPAPQHLELDAEGLLWVCDACNHRIQVFDPTWKTNQVWGEDGSEPGQI